jgi:allophanate hydrolase
MTQAPSWSTTLVVCGAHLRGQPLNPFLMELGAVFTGIGRTAPSYRMYALPPTTVTPARPGLVRQVRGGSSIEVESYRLPIPALGALMVTVGAPLAIGHLLLEDGSEPLGFVCEAYGADTGADITDFGSWRDYLALLTDV